MRAKIDFTVYEQQIIAARALPKALVKDPEWAEAAEEGMALKGDAGKVFEAYPDKRQDDEIDQDLQRLGVAAMSMFNRAALHILTDTLNADIAYFGLERKYASSPGQALTQADLLLGGFFFVHESKSRHETGHEAASINAFEFLHNTFGEFLTADFIARRLVSEVQTANALSASPQLREVLEQRLRSTDSLPEHWYVSLMYAPLHTRPVILQMLAEWTRHVCRESGLAVPEFLDRLGEIVSHQLLVILKGSNLPSVMKAEKQTPYAPLALLEHIATYSLNLVLIRAVLSDDGYAVEDGPDGPLPVGSWESLTHLWRASLSAEVLDGLSSVMTATRVADDKVNVVVEPEGRRSSSGERLKAVLSLSRSLGDDVTLGLGAMSAYLVDTTRKYRLPTRSYSC